MAYSVSSHVPILSSKAHAEHRADTRFEPALRRLAVAFDRRIGPKALATRDAERLAMVIEGSLRRLATGLVRAERSHWSLYKQVLRADPGRRPRIGELIDQGRSLIRDFGRLHDRLLQALRSRAEDPTLRSLEVFRGPVLTWTRAVQDHEREIHGLPAS